MSEYRQSEGGEYTSQESENRVQTVELDRAARNFKIYEELEKKVEDDKILQGLLNMVLDAGKIYTRTVWEHQDATRRMREGELEFEQRELVERKDKTRHIAHNSLIDKMNIFARACNNKGLDISSIRDILTQGSEEKRRVEIAQFVLDVLDQLALKSDAEEKKKKKGGRHERGAN